MMKRWFWANRRTVNITSILISYNCISDDDDDEFIGIGNWKRVQKLNTIIVICYFKQRNIWNKWIQRKQMNSDVLIDDHQAEILLLIEYGFVLLFYYFVL